MWMEDRFTASPLLALGLCASAAWRLGVELLEQEG